MVVIRTAAEAEVLRELREQKSLEWLGYWRTSNKRKIWTGKQFQIQAQHPCASVHITVFLVFLIPSLFPSQWLLIPTIWATRHSHVLLKYLATLGCLFSAPWQLSGLGRQTNNYDSDQLLPYMAVFCLWDASHGDWSARLWGMQPEICLHPRITLHNHDVKSLLVK